MYVSHSITGRDIKSDVCAGKQTGFSGFESLTKHTIIVQVLTEYIQLIILWMVVGTMLHTPSFFNLWVHYDFYADISYFNGIFPQNVTVQSYPANRTTLNTLG